MDLRTGNKILWTARGNKDAVKSPHLCRSIGRVACVAGPQFYGWPDLQRAGFCKAQGRI